MEVVADPDLLAYSESCIRIASFEFTRTSTLPRFALFSDSSVPELRLLSADEPAVILDGDRGDWRFQLGHEVFHWLVTPPEAAPGIVHWTHEWLAIETSLLCLRGSGLTEEAEERESRLREHAGAVSREEVVTRPLPRPYDVMYGGIFEVGRDLRAAVGWGHAKRLASALDWRYQVDVRGWVGSLPSDLQEKARAALRAPDVHWA